MPKGRQHDHAGRSSPILHLGVRQAPADRRGVNSSQVADPWISPLTNLHPPDASRGNMYLQRSQRTSGVAAGL